jgi:hypothetical protein
MIGSGRSVALTTLSVRGREAKDDLVCGLFALRGQKRVFSRKLEFSHLNYWLTVSVAPATS